MFADHTFIYEHCVTSGRHFTDDMAKMVPVSCIDYTVQTCYLRFCDTWVCVIQERWTTVSVCWTSVKPACQTTVSVTCYPSHLNTASYCWRTSTRRSLVKMPLNWVSYHHVSLMSAPACTYCMSLSRQMQHKHKAECYNQEKLTSHHVTWSAVARTTECIFACTNWQWRSDARN